MERDGEQLGLTVTVADGELADGAGVQNLGVQNGVQNLGVQNVRLVHTGRTWHAPAESSGRSATCVRSIAATCTQHGRLLA